MDMNHFTWLVAIPKDTHAPWQIHVVGYYGGYRSQQMRSWSSWFTKHSFDDPNMYWDSGCNGKHILRGIFAMREGIMPNWSRADVVLIKHKSIWDFYKHIRFDRKTKKYTKYKCETDRTNEKTTISNGG